MPQRSATPLDQQKRTLRAEAKRRRAAAARDADVAARAADAVCARLLNAVPVPPDAVVSAYWPMGSELDPRPLMKALHERGHRLCLPTVAGAGQPLVFRAWAPGDALGAAGFGTHEPAADQPVLTPEVLLVPLLAFDRAGYRLGYGGGFYDRTLACLREAGAPLAVAVAFAAQEVASVPHTATDRRVDWIVTEREAIPVG